MQLIEETTLRLARCGLSLVLLLASPCGHAASVTDWVPYQRFDTYKVSGNANAGKAVALSSDWLAIGIPGDLKVSNNIAYEQSGTVLVYHWDAGGWTFRFDFDITHVGGAPRANTHFGAALALSGDRLLIGCPGCDAGWHAALVNLVGSSGKPTAIPIPLLGAEEEVTDPDLGAGSAVALKGNLLAIGSPLAAPFGSAGQIGVVDIGAVSGSTLVWDHAFRGEQVGSLFGASIAIEYIDSGGTIPTRTSYLAVGAPGYVNSGSIAIAGRAYLYRDTLGSDWNHVQIFANPQAGLADALGRSVAITFAQPDGSTGGQGLFAIGAPGRAFNGAASGTVQIFRAATTSGTFSLEQEIGRAGGKAYDRFGSALALLPENILVGANGKDVDLATEAGSAYRFRRSYDGIHWYWPLQQVLVPRNGNEAFGVAVAAATERGAAVGSPNFGSADTGAVQTYLCDAIFINGFDDVNAVKCERF